MHFGIRTFYEGHQDWDGIYMPPTAFNPKKLDTRQWISTAKKAGINYCILVCKHHDGFANWPSKYTDYSVAATPYKNGKGDIVKEFTDACHEFNMGVGLYYSPADAHVCNQQDAHVGAQQDAHMCNQQDAQQNKKSKSDKEYDDYFINQVSELLKNYGKIDYIWFDGCGSENHKYNWTRIIGEMKKLQPDMLIFNMGEPDTRWVGNEAGIVAHSFSNVTDSLKFSVKTDKSTNLINNKWLPVECDMRLHDKNWFYSERDRDKIKSVDELMGIYYYSVGRGANLLMNIGPNREGLLDEVDAKRLLEFGSEIKRRFSNPVATLDNFSKADNKISLKFSNPTLINHVVLEENILNGQNICSFKIKVSAYPKCGEDVTVYEGKYIGHKAICYFPTIKTENIAVEFETESGNAQIKATDVFYIKRT